MGEAKRRAERRAQARAEGKAFEPTPAKAEKQRALGLLVRRSVFDALEAEYEEFLKAKPGLGITRNAFIEGLLETTANQMRVAREHPGRMLVTPPTPVETATILGGAAYKGRR